MIKQRFVLPLLAALALSACATAQTPPPGSIAKGMVSAADPRAAEAGAEMLRQGGTATDAAIATMLALTVVEPQSSGIGGGGFYVHGTPDGTVETLDGRETAPGGAKPDWFLGADGKPLPFDQAVKSGLSIGVPGNLALAAEAHRRHGKLEWATLFEPAIRLARDGWTLSARAHQALTRSADTASRDPAGKALFFDAAGTPLPVGTMLRNPALADTLEKLAQQGAAVFYRGPDALAMADRITKDTPRPGGMTAGDLAGYEAKWRDPVCGAYRTYRICGMGPPSSGATTVLAILGQLEHLDLSQMRADSPAFWHVFAESQRLAYADRERFLGDADFINVPVERLIDPAYLARRGAAISADKTLSDVSPGLDLAPPAGDGPPEKGTSHFVAIDSAGSIISYTSTVEGPFGSGLMFGGLYLNNELTDFSFTPEKDGRAVANRVEGGKRPRSSMAPTIVYGPDGKPVLAVGAAGGATIPVQVARALIGYLDWGMTIDEALALPVLFSPGDTVVVEKGTALETLIPALEALGHARVVTAGLPLKANAIAVLPTGELAGAADPRSEGIAVAE